MRIKEDIKIKEIAGERVAIRQGKFGVDMTKIIAFNPTAEWLWNQLSGKDFSKEDVVGLLIDAYNLDETTADLDAQKWIEQCINANIVEIGSKF